MRSHNLTETRSIAQKFLDSIKPLAGQAAVVALSGDLGSGKTTFVQQLAQVLGITERVISPTFIIEKFYQLPAGAKFKQLVHLDCYRLETSSELAKLNWAEVINNPANLVLVEWAEKVQDILPANYRQINFTFINETEREIELD
jgi:tRNA threonylcarbamoyladenosine biosynthesis protein TsaE